MKSKTSSSSSYKSAGYVVFRVLWPSLPKQAKFGLGILFFFILAASTLTAIAPIPFKYFIDSLSMNTGRQIDLVYLSLPLTLLVYCGLFFLLRLVGETQIFLYGLHEQKLLNTLRITYLHHLHKLPLSFHINKKIGEKEEVLGQTINAVRALFSALFLSILPILFEITSILIVVSIFYEWSYLLVLASCLVVYIFVMIKGANILAHHQRQNRDTLMQSRGLAGDCILNIETTKIFASETYFEDKYQQILKKTDQITAAFSRSRIYIGVGQIILLTLGLLAINMLASIDYQQELMTIGGVILVNTYLLQLFRPLERISFSYREVRNAIVMLEKTAEIFAVMPEKTGATQPPPTPGPLSIRLEQVGLSYQQKPILQDISFSLESGQTFGIVGETGAGKTSLIRLVLGLIKPTTGRINLNNIPIHELDLKKLRQEIAVVPQNPLLFHDTLLENLRFANPKVTLQEIELAMDQASLDSFIKTLPHGLNSMVGAMGMKLSGGEKQRLALARAILKKPRLFIFDEATASVDAQTEAVLIENMKKISTGISTLIVSHRLNNVAHAQEILVLRQGKIIERGTHHTLIAQKGYYSQLWNQQSGNLGQRS